MGYDLYITRKEFNADKGSNIVLEEWLSIVEHDPELTFSELNKQNYPYHADWSGLGKYPCWLDYADGNLYSKNPTDEMVEKMVLIAKLLNAKVQGDDGEEYLGGGRTRDRDQNGEWVVYPLSDE